MSRGSAEDPGLTSRARFLPPNDPRYTAVELPTARTPDRPRLRPWAYFLTFACYGSRLHGDPRGSVDDAHNTPFTRLLDASPRRVAHEKGLMRQPEVTLSAAEREIVLEAFEGVCRHELWDLHAAHVRSNHVHVVLTAAAAPERAMAKLKAYATRALNECFGPKKRRWATHRSTRWLWDVHEATMAVHYVIGAQGERMALYVSSPSWLPANRETEPGT